MRIGSGLREGDRPRETPTLPGLLRGREMGTHGDARPPARKKSVFNPCSIRGWQPIRLRNAECGSGKTEPRDCRLRSMRTLGEASSRFGVRAGDRAVRGRVRSRNGQLNANNVRLCSLMFAYVRLLGEKCLEHRARPALRAASVARGQCCARPVLRTATVWNGERPETAENTKLTQGFAPLHLN